MRLCYLAACINVCGGEFPDLLNLPHVLEITDHWIDSKSGGVIMFVSRPFYSVRFIFFMPATPRPRLSKCVAWWEWRLTDFRVDYLRNR